MLQLTLIKRVEHMKLTHEFEWQAEIARVNQSMVQNMRVLKQVNAETWQLIFLHHGPFENMQFKVKSTFRSKLA